MCPLRSFKWTDPPLAGQTSLALDNMIIMESVPKLTQFKRIKL